MMLRKTLSVITRNRTVPVIHSSVRQFSVTRMKWNSDGEDQIKNDQDVKKWMQEINKDFDQKTKSVTDDPKKEETPSSKAKNVSQLLSELYGEAETKSDTTESFSSVGGYVEYVDKDSDVIYDIDEEREILRKAYLEGKELEIDKRKKTSPAEKYKYLSHTRGDRGVFEIAEIVELLSNERIADVAVIKIPEERKYADFMVIGTANSDRHLRTVGSLIVSVFKRKRWLSDPVPRIEGHQEKNSGWNALDLGNIVVHLQTQEQREYYDLETLWTVGPEFDEKTSAMESAGEVNRLSRLEELMKTDFDPSLLYENQEETTQGIDSKQ